MTGSSRWQAGRSDWHSAYKCTQEDNSVQHLVFMVMFLDFLLLQIKVFWNIDSFASSQFHSQNSLAFGRACTCIFVYCNLYLSKICLLTSLFYRHEIINQLQIYQVSNHGKRWILLVLQYILYRQKGFGEPIDVYV